MNFGNVNNSFRSHKARVLLVQRSIVAIKVFSTVQQQVLVPERIQHNNYSKKKLGQITIRNSAGVATQAIMLVTGRTQSGELKWERPFPYMDCQECGYGPSGCDCSKGFIQG